jgi:hypothetical protein
MSHNVQENTALFKERLDVKDKTENELVYIQREFKDFPKKTTI